MDIRPWYTIMFHNEWHADNHEDDWNCELGGFDLFETADKLGHLIAQRPYSDWSSNPRYNITIFRHKAVEIDGDVFVSQGYESANEVDIEKVANHMYSIWKAAKDLELSEKARREAEKRAKEEEHQKKVRHETYLKLKKEFEP